MDRKQEYDTTLKLLIAGRAEGTLRQLGVSGPISRWLNVELPKVQNQRVDLLAEIAAGQLLHIELQSTNVLEMSLRMLEYGAGIWRVQGVFPRQMLLYVGNDKLRMPNGFQAPGINYRYDLMDIRDLDGEALVASDCPADNILAVLTRMDDKAMTIRRILGKLRRWNPGNGRMRFANFCYYPE